MYRETLRDGMLQAARWAARRPFAATGLYVLLISALFLVLPQLDLWASGLFHDPQAGFFAQDEPFLRRLRHLGPHLVQLVAGACVTVLLVKLLLPGRAPLLPLHIPLFLLSTLILGPGLLVNSLLKNTWGRPRPNMVESFGGDMPYVPVWLPSGWCDTNCSFVSGEASSGMWLVGLAFVVPKDWRLPTLAFTVPLCLLLSVNRIAFGGHFLSDTLLSWGLTLLVLLAVHRLLFVAPPAWARDAALDETLTRAGRRLQERVVRAALRGYAAARRFVAMFR